MVSLNKKNFYIPFLSPFLLFFTISFCNLAGMSTPSISASSSTSTQQANCPICLEEFKDDEGVAILNEPHCRCSRFNNVYHIRCIATHFRTKQEEKVGLNCPICKEVIKDINNVPRMSYRDYTMRLSMYKKQISIETLAQRYQAIRFNFENTRSKSQPDVKKLEMLRDEVISLLDRIRTIPNLNLNDEFAHNLSALSDQLYTLLGIMNYQIQYNEKFEEKQSFFNPYKPMDIDEISSDDVKNVDQIPHFASPIQDPVKAGQLHHFEAPVSAPVIFTQTSCSPMDLREF